MTLKNTITAIIRSGEQFGYVAECKEISVVTQENTLDEVVSNLKKAVSLHLEDEDPADFGLLPHPTLIAVLELQPEYT